MMLVIDRRAGFKCGAIPPQIFSQIERCIGATDHLSYLRQIAFGVERTDSDAAGNSNVLLASLKGKTAYLIDLVIPEPVAMLVFGQN